MRERNVGIGSISLMPTALQPSATALASIQGTPEPETVPPSGASGDIDALVNNAAISPKNSDGSRLSTLNTPIEDWHQVFAVNFFASMLLGRGLVEELERARGAIVNVTSIAGSRVHPFAGAAYATSKAALAALTREMAARRQRHVETEGGEE